ncbi:lysozyme inhibitor LprI family protein [Citrobacter youngae]|uniref:lysozyme inhibitor LprI family protein n=1 Tax=Citrobacter youngae TaxID=133448 RepID=UPI000E2FDE38|nr:lysozyme inhibitor LprI family protein [Citrobacter youngae]MCO4161771.1 lysozyme inhibitor LprI family protein [Citrobacter youngae]
MKRLKMTRLMMLALVLAPLTSMAAPPQAFNFSCASIGGVNSDGKGNVWINGAKATIKSFNENYWEAKSGKNTVSISRKDDGNPEVSWAGPNRKHGICQPEDNVDFAVAKKSTHAGPSFSCSAVEKGSMEEIICQSPSLSAMDLKLNGVYKQALAKSKNDPMLKAEQRGWIKGRNECWKEQDKPVCLAREYSGRMTELQNKWGVK